MDNLVFSTVSYWRGGEGRGGGLNPFSPPSNVGLVTNPTVAHCVFTLQIFMPARSPAPVQLWENFSIHIVMHCRFEEKENNTQIDHFSVVKLATKILTFNSKLQLCIWKLGSLINFFWIICTSKCELQIWVFERIIIFLWKSFILISFKSWQKLLFHLSCNGEAKSKHHL